jgi:hypothetical protein
MTLPTNGITPEIIRAAMPPYELSTDLLAAMLAAVPAPPAAATMAWRQERAGRLVQEVAGLIPADAPQARIAAEIVIAREAADGSIARANTPGLAVEGAAAVGMAGLIPGSSPGTAMTAGVPAMTVGAGESGAAAEADRGDDPAAAEAGRGDSPAAMVGACGDSPDAAEGESGDSPAATVGRRAPAGPGRGAGSTPAWTTSRLDRGPGWTLDVVRPRRVDDVAGEDNLGDNAGAAEFRAAEFRAAGRAGSKAASDAAPARLA